MQFLQHMYISKRFDGTAYRGIATNSGLGGQVQIETFLYRKYERGINESNLYSWC